jgi:hypothetical protein
MTGGSGKLFKGLNSVFTELAELSFRDLATLSYRENKKKVAKNYIVSVSMSYLIYGMTKSTTTTEPEFVKV